MSKKAFWILAVGVGLGLAARPGAAQPEPAPSPVILRIEVQGDHWTPSEQILTWFALRTGDRFEPTRVSRALKQLTRRRRFADVRVDGEETSDGVVLHLVVQEYPRLGSIRIEGTDRVKEKDVRAVLRLAQGKPLHPADRSGDGKRISDLYREKGFYRASVNDTVQIEADGGRTLVVRIDEGEKGSIQEIVFTGNEHVTAKKLRKQMETKKDGFLSGGELKEDLLQEDFDRLAAYYRTLGHLDAQVTGHEIDVDEAGKDLTLRIHVTEGPRYNVGAVEWTGNDVFEDDAIRRCVRLEAGKPFDESAYEATTTALYELYNDAGYIHFSATPRRDVRDDKVHLTYLLDEGLPARVHHIRIVGNTKTHDKVILREFMILPGDRFDRSKLLRSVREVYALGFFEDVGIERFTPRDDGGVDLELRVVERQTGQLGAGAGYSAINAVTGFLEVAETNLFGTGKRLSLRWEFSKRQNEIDFSYTQPWLFDTPTSLGLQLFNSSRRSRINDFYRDKRTGGALTIGRRLHFLDYTRLSWRYRAESIELTDFAESYNGPLRERFAGGPRRTFSTGLTVRRNSTDRPFFPTAGSTSELSTDLIGTFLGGDESYLRLQSSLAWYRGIGGTKFTLMLRSRFGLLHGLQGHDTPDYELFRLGGNRYYGVRGYDDFEVVPAGNPLFLGGRAMSVFTSEIVYPFSPKLHGVVFFDAGNTWNSFQEAELSLLRKGAGIGVRVEVPMLGQLGLDYGYGFDRTDSFGRSRDGWNLHFNFGSLF